MSQVHKDHCHGDAQQKSAANTYPTYAFNASDSRRVITGNADRQSGSSKWTILHKPLITLSSFVERFTNLSLHHSQCRSAEFWLRSTDRLMIECTVWVVNNLTSISDYNRRHLGCGDSKIFDQLIEP